MLKIMKKFLISIIIILTLLIIGQLIYFNTRTERASNNNNIVNEMPNEEDDVKHIEVEEPIITEVIYPSKVDVLSRTYKGDIKIVTLEKELYKFVNNSIKTIYNDTTGKNQNQVSQIYDLKMPYINSMNIYSKEDFLQISAESLKVGGVANISYAYSSIDMESYKDDEDGYATFNLKVTYSNNEEINIKVYLANSSSTLPNIKFGKQ